jgi:hypothetical protein
MRWIASLTAIGFLCAVSGAPLRAAEGMYLADVSPPNYNAYGWTFTGLTLLSLGYGVYAYGKSQDELDQADKNYKLYKSAKTTESALKYRNKTEDHHDEAKNYETRANTAIALTLVFGLTAIYSFDTDLGPNMSLTSSLGGAVFTWRF